MKLVDRILKISKDCQNCKLSYYHINNTCNNNNMKLISALGMFKRLSNRPVGRKSKTDN